MRENFEKLLPLPSAALHILMALAVEDMHGYAIMQESARQGCKMGPGTLYDNLQRLLDQKFVEELKSDDPRRRYYRLSARGRALLAADITRLDHLVRRAQQHLRLRRST
jgi:DNA-binding PadR family transcriptional regulator